MFACLQSFDWAVLHGIRMFLHCAALDALMPLVTALGNGGAVWFAAALLLTATKKYRRYGIALFAALAVGAALGVACLKPLVARPRPCWLENVPLLIPRPEDYSFPSGHTLCSVIGAYLLTAANRRFGLLAVPLAAAIAFSRLYLYVHFPTDVLASVVLGTFIGWCAVTLLRKGCRLRPCTQKKPGAA